MFCECADTKPTEDNIPRYCQHCGKRIMTAEQAKVDSLLDGCARQALAEGVPANDSGEYGGALHRWIATRTNIAPHNHFYAIMCIGMRMLNLQAQNEGYADWFDRACALNSRLAAKFAPARVRDAPPADARRGG